MTLNASGQISLGGSTTGQSVNLELGKSATAQISFNDTDVRNLTETSSGTALVMPTNFYGKTKPLDVQTVTTGSVGSASPSFNRQRGYSVSAGIGSISTGFSTIYNQIIEELKWVENGGSPDSYYQLGIQNATNSGWTTIKIGSKSLTRASATSTLSGGVRYWQWSTTDSSANQAFGAASSVITVRFT